MQPALAPDLQQELERFLQDAPQFHLGGLVTEQAHPVTTDLSRLAIEDPEAAVQKLREVDLQALNILAERAPDLRPLAEAIRKTLETGNRIFLCGCGATGRLSLSLEIFSRAGLMGDVPQEALVAFMAGGDAALIRSIESFEDFPEYGARQLRELGFTEGDLFLGITEGGETSFVIGATEEALGLSSVTPFFLYCNPDEVLAPAADRSRRVLENPAIHKINLTVGPMAITGSTRMQASTVQMAAAGWAILARKEPEKLPDLAQDFLNWLDVVDLRPLARFIEREAEVYQSGRWVLYEPGEFGITVLTDTTERSPTFSLTPFESRRNPDDSPSLSYLHLEGTASPEEAWRKLLGREPRTLEWDHVRHRTGREIIMGFDFSDRVVELRGALGTHEVFRIVNRPDSIRLDLEGLVWDIPAEDRSLFSRHLMLKMVLNMHSTLVMGRLGRFRGNVMTWVKPTNNKLIDRAIRYVKLLLKEHHASASYEEVAREIFHQRAMMQPDESVVLRTVDALEKH